MNNNNRCFVNGLILTIVTLFLIIYFTFNSMWGAAQVVVLIILALIASAQYLLHFKFFRK